MRRKFVQKIGALILTVLMLSGVAALSTSTAQARHRRVIVAPRVYVGRQYHRVGTTGITTDGTGNSIVDT